MFQSRRCSSDLPSEIRFDSVFKSHFSIMRFEIFLSLARICDPCFVLHKQNNFQIFHRSCRFTIGVQFNRIDRFFSLWLRYKLQIRTSKGEGNYNSSRTLTTFIKNEKIVKSLNSLKSCCFKRSVKPRTSLNKTPTKIIFLNKTRS